MNVKRGMVFMTDAGETLGSEQSGMRPAVVLQNNVGNSYSPTTIVGFMTSKDKRPLPTHVALRSDGLRKQSYALLEQVRTLSKQRLGRYICTLSEIDMQKIDEALKISFGIER